MRRKRLTKTMKVSISLPKDQVDYLDEVAEDVEVSRSEVIQWIINGIMDDEDLEAQFFEIVEDEEIDEGVDEESGTEDSE